MKLKINAIERVRTMGNNLNKDNNKYLLLNNNIHKYYVNSNHENHDCFQSHMVVHKNPKAQSGQLIPYVFLIIK